MRVLFDTNIVLDVLLDRQPFSIPATSLFIKVERGVIDGFMCATTVTTIHYLSTKVIGKEAAANQVRSLLSLFDIAPVNRPILESAVDSGFDDFEDAVVYESARHSGVQAIVTRDMAGSKRSDLPILSPNELLNMLLTLGS